jgi:hypothetical protein
MALGLFSCYQCLTAAIIAVSLPEPKSRHVFNMFLRGNFMKSLYASGILSLVLLGGCAGGQTAVPSASQPLASLALSGTPGAHPGACAAISTSQNFNGTPISKGSWMLFTSELSVRGSKAPIVLEMRQSLITFKVGQTHYAIEGPNMRLELTNGHTVQLHFPAFGDQWKLTAPYAATGRDFLNSIAYQTTNHLPGDITDATWSAKFFGKDGRAIQWQWGAAVYNKLTNRYAKLNVKALDDANYPPFNTNRAGTPEAFKQYVTGGGTGNGGTNYTGTMSSPVSVTPCKD